MSDLQPVSLAYSPDTDDAFMVEAMRTKRVDTKGYAFTYTAADIQQLNEAARSGTYDLTAISIAAYPALARDYWLMPVGASIGDNFGPALIVRTGSPLRRPEDLTGRRIAVPGKQTSAYFAAVGLIGAFEAVPCPFDQISTMVQTGAVDAGILIHELQLDCTSAGCEKIGDLGQLWAQRFDLPLPLGANAIRRSLGLKAVQEITAVLRDSIETGLNSREDTLRAALASSNAGLDLKDGDRYISMYVNQRSLGFARDVREAMGRLFAIGAEAGLCPPCDLAEAFYE